MFETCNTEWKIIVFDRQIKPLPAIKEKVPSAILTREFPRYEKYE